MPNPRLNLLRTVFLLLALTGPVLCLPAKTSDWKDLQGTSFRGEPVEVLGPFAVFRTSGGGGRRVLLRGLAPEDCLRFQRETAERPPRAASLALAKGRATGELVDHVLQVRNRKLVPADLAALPEPQLLLVLYGSHNDGESWRMLDNMLVLHQRIQRVYPGLLNTVFFGIRHNEAEHREMALSKWMPWLVADFHEQRTMSLLGKFIPAEGTNMVLLSRNGVPLLSGRATDLADTRRFIDQVNELVSLLTPDNPRAWKDRAHYLSATRLQDYAQGRTDPLLVGNPLRADGLRQRGVRKVVAKLAVAADGTVSPTLQSDASELPEKLVAPLTKALGAAVVLPAVDHGIAVAGQLDYVLEVPLADPRAEADAFWIGSDTRAELPLPNWLVLRPIKVSEQDFGSEVDHVTESGTVVYKAMEVTDAKVTRGAQLSAFHTDWFAASGAAGVQPRAGDKQTIDDNKLTWESVKAVDGYVDLQGGIQRLDYTVGYAWTEIEAPADMEAWLGIGSDDGLKIWFNGELVHDKWVRRISSIDEDVVPLRLRKGPNRMLLKIQNVTGDWSFVTRLRIRVR